MNPNKTKTFGTIWVSSVRELNKSNMEDKITQVFSGTLVEVEFVAQIMEDNGIEYLIRDLERESRIAGWVADIIPQKQCALFVFEHDYDQAMDLIKEIGEADFGEEIEDEI